MRRKAYKYIGASIRHGSWLPDPDMLRPVDVASLDGICISTRWGYYETERKNVFFATSWLQDERFACLLIKIAEERGLNSVWLMYPTWRRMLESVAGEFWAAFPLAMCGVGFPDLLPQDSARWSALILHKILPRLTDVRRFESIMFDGSSGTIFNTRVRMQYWCLGAYVTLTVVLTRFSNGADYRQQRWEEVKNMSLDEFIPFAQKEIKPLLPPDGRWVEPAAYAGRAPVLRGFTENGQGGGQARGNAAT
jgi:hypothetical protein